LKSKLISVLSVFAFALLFFSLALPAFAAEDIRLQVNGDVVPSPGIYLQDGYCMISVDKYVNLAGAEFLRLSDSDFSIIENGATLNFSAGKKEVTLDGQQMTLPVAPAKTGEAAFIPLRAISSIFGFNVEWNGEQGVASLSRNETRDGMTASDLLAKSTVASQAYNTYSMQGHFNIDVITMADGETYGQAPISMDTSLTGQIQYDPMQIYIKQAIKPVSEEDVSAMDIETYMTIEKIYIKTPGQEWIVQDMPFSPEFWKQQQDIQSDPLKAVEQMKEMGILLNYGNDVSVNGENYYVLNATLDMEKFKQSFQKIFQQAMQGMAPDENSGNSIDIQKQIQKVFEEAKLDFKETILVNKKTLFSDIVKLDAWMEMSMENPAQAEQGQQEKDNGPKEIKMNIKMNGEFTISNPGDPFNAPDVSGAKEMKSLENVIE
jgi:hypothetical protein